MTLAAGGKVDAGDFVPGVSIGIPAYVFKGAAETVTDSATIQNDDALFFTMVPGARYVVDVIVAAKATATADFKSDWDGPVDMTGGKWALGPAATTSGGVVARDDANGRFGFHGTATDIDYTMASASSDSMIREWGWVESATGGTFRWRWAQNTETAAAESAIVNSASYMVYTRVS
ncbi:MAG: hypothetical protein HY830_14000 [Actinobacteria bacterium]|nr:hypothetical protein [Actinomycetota bacterium]